MQKILIVDDELMMLKIATRILSKKYQVVCALSGEEALEIFNDEKPDMVLSDLLMPEMDGYELHRKLQEKSSYPIPMMFMTADESDESESRGFEIGAADYIRKPLRPDILMRRVANILDNLDKIHGLEQAADLDTMTGLLNKSASERELSKLCKTSQGVLFMIDLDNFKLVNDIYGHAMGDKILIKLAELLNESMEKNIIGRMGGDEFIAFFENIHDENFVAEKSKFLNEKLLENAKKFMGEEMSIPLGVSIGAIFVPDEGREFSALYKKADQALYEVKLNGKHSYAIYSDKHKTPIFATDENIHKILSERNATTDAYFVEPEYFRVIYRLAVRLVKSYKKNAQFLVLNISEKDNAEEFKNLLLKTLRSSDCITQNGKNQFLILMMDTSAIEYKFIKSRLVVKSQSSNFEIRFVEESSL